MKQKKQKNNSDCKLSLRPVSGEKDISATSKPDNWSTVDGGIECGKNEPKQTKKIKSAKWDEER